MACLVARPKQDVPVDSGGPDVVTMAGDRKVKRALRAFGVKGSGSTVGDGTSGGDCDVVVPEHRGQTVQFRASECRRLRPVLEVIDTSHSTGVFESDRRRDGCQFVDVEVKTCTSAGTGNAQGDLVMTALGRKWKGISPPK